MEEMDRRKSPIIPRFEMYSQQMGKALFRLIEIGAHG